MKKKYFLAIIILTVCLFAFSCKTKSYSINYEMNGGEKQSDWVTSFTIKDEVVLPTPVLKDKVFEGWYTNSFYSGNPITKIEKGTQESITVYAKWKEKTYSIDYQLDGGKIPDDSPTTYNKEEVVLPTPTKEDYTFEGWYTNSTFDGTPITKIEENTKKDITLYAKWKVIPFKLVGKTSMDELSSQIIKITFLDSTVSQKITWTSSDINVVSLGTIRTGSIKVDSLSAGHATITATNADGLSASIEVKVNGTEYSITYNLTEEEKALMPSEYPTNYTTGEETILPTLAMDHFVFLGWSTQTSLYPDSYQSTDKMEGDLVLTPAWRYPHIDVYYETSSITSVGDTLTLIGEKKNLGENDKDSTILWSSSDEEIATVDEHGVVTGVKEGFVTIMAKLDTDEQINMTVGITINNDQKEISEVLNYFKQNQVTEIIAKQLTAFGDVFNYDFDCLGSVTNYLFEPLSINEMIVPKTLQEGGKIINRPGTIKPKYYICVHDTGETIEYATAEYWAKEVNLQEREVSWHYTVGNDGIYHQVPDNEVAYHAGDGTHNPYELYATGVKAVENTKGVVTISDGYYCVNGEKTSVAVPTNTSGTVNKPCTTEDINDLGIRCVIQNGEYYLGNTYYNSTYRKIANYGGNNNSIGIETCVTNGTDVYYTWQKCAKLVAKLLVDNDLTFDDIVQHHYFSGKNCPQTMRTGKLWDNFIALCKAEYAILTMFSDYQLTFTSNDPEYVNSLGRVIKWPTYSRTVSYTITAEKNGIKDSITLHTLIPGKVLSKTK